MESVAAEEVVEVMSVVMAAEGATAAVVAVVVAAVAMVVLVDNHYAIHLCKCTPSNCVGVSIKHVSTCTDTSI